MPLTRHSNERHFKKPNESGQRDGVLTNIVPPTTSQLKNSTPSKLNESKNVLVRNEDTESSLSISSSLPNLPLNPFINNSAIDFDSPKEQSFSNGNRISYRLMVGKEWSSVGAMAKITGGYKIGGEVAYQFNNKLQLSTGLGVSMKKYETEGVNTVGLQARIAWADDVPPETVYGKCTVIEIPLDFNFYFKDFRSNGFFVGGGLNSYLMASEWYDFKFDPQYASQNELFWTTQDKNMKMKNHLFSIVSAQFGYQHQISNKLAIQVAPYIQIPLTGIGMGDVDLVSTGVQIKLAFAK